jgi:hypothetical protein
MPGGYLNLTGLARLPSLSRRNSTATACIMLPQTNLHMADIGRCFMWSLTGVV